jgi:hypothetical protein
MAYQRDYKREYELQKQKGESGTGHDSGSAVRHRARRKALKLGLLKNKADDVDHKTPLVKGGSETDASNLREESVHKNRSFPRTKTAGMK